VVAPGDGTVVLVTGVAGVACGVAPSVALAGVVATGVPAGLAGGVGM